MTVRHRYIIWFWENLKKRTHNNIRLDVADIEVFAWFFCDMNGFDAKMNECNFELTQIRWRMAYYPDDWARASSIPGPSFDAMFCASWLVPTCVACNFQDLAETGSVSWFPSFGVFGLTPHNFLLIVLDILQPSLLFQLILCLVESTFTNKSCYK